MTELTMIGLGAMGSAIAKAFLGAGHSVSVWNRTPSKAIPFTTLGAITYESFSEAVRASPIIVVCVDNYNVTKNLLKDTNAGNYLTGKILIQLSTGTPKEALELDENVKGLGGEYIDGVIRPYPEDIGDADAQILFAGAESSYSRCKHFLDCLGGGNQYLGSNIKAAAVMEMASLTYDLSCYLGVMHAARICESENVDVSTFASTYPDSNPASYIAKIIHSNDFGNPGATISVWQSAFKGIETQAKDTGINAEIPEFIAGFFRRAIAAGYGEEDIAAIVKLLRESNAV